jgi:hypothetical protein
VVATPSLHVVKTRVTKPNGRVYEYAYLRYEVWDEAKRRLQPVPVAALGRTDTLEDGRLQSLGDFLREWLRKDSSLPFEALKARFSEAEPAFRILCSRDFGLRFLVEQVWRELGYAEALTAITGGTEKGRRLEIAVFAMVLVQLIAPQSKRGVSRWAGAEVFFPETSQLDLDDLYAAMDALEAGYPVIEKALSERLHSLDAVPTEFAQDTTTITCRVRYDDVERAAIEADRQANEEVRRPAVVNDPPLRMRGKSKDKRNDLPQVVLNAVLGDNNLVVHHSVEAGNTSDKRLVEPVVAALQQLGYQRVLWTGDAGFNSAANREVLRAANFEFVTGEGIARSKVVQKVLSTPGRYQPHPDRPELSFKCVRAEATEEARRGQRGPKRLYVIRRNTEEERFALRTIDRHLATIQDVLAAGGKKAERLLTHPTYRRYVRRDARTKDAQGRAAGAPIVDRSAVEHLRRLAGKSVMASDCLEAHPLFVHDLYQLTAEIERVFRELKSSINVGPLRHRRADRIRAHVMIAVMARNLGAWLQRKTGLTLDALRSLFANVRVQQVQAGSAEYWERVDLEPAQESVFAQLGFDLPPKRFTVSVAFPSNSGLAGASR